MDSEPVLLAFTAHHVQRLTGLSARQLGYWDRTGFFSPQHISLTRSHPFGRIYSFRDVVGLRTIASIRKSVPLQELRKIGHWLSERHEAPWSSLRFYVAGRRVFFDDPGTGARVEARHPGQRVMPIEMQLIASEMAAAAARLRDRTPEDFGRIVRHRYVVHNASVIAGTRIPTAAVWDFHQAGYSTAEIRREYPRLTELDVDAAIDYEVRRQRRAAS